MDTTRRQFFKILGTAGAAAGAGLDGPEAAEAAAVPAPKTAGATTTTTICPFCGVGAKRQPPLWLTPGDVVEVDISFVGILRNPVAQED